MPRKIIKRCVNLEPNDYRIVRQYAEELGLGSKGFSAALRLLIREWAELRKITDQLRPDSD